MRIKQIRQYRVVCCVAVLHLVSVENIMWCLVRRWREWGGGRLTENKRFEIFDRRGQHEKKSFFPSMKPWVFFIPFLNPPHNITEADDEEFTLALVYWDCNKAHEIKFWLAFCEEDNRFEKKIRLNTLLPRNRKEKRTLNKGNFR